MADAAVPRSASSLPRLAFAGGGAALLLFAAFYLYLSGQVVLGVILLALATGFAIIFGANRFYGARFIFPGVAAVLVFIALPVGYTIGLGSTNYSSFNLLTQERATEVLTARGSIDPATEQPFAVAQDGDGYRIWLPDAGLLSDPVALSADGPRPAITSVSTGKTGDVEIYAPGCEGRDIRYGTVAEAYSYGPWWTVTERPGGYPVCFGPGCAPAPCWVTGTCAPPPSACMKIDTGLTCDSVTGLWTLTAGVTGVGGFAPDSLKVTTASPGVSIANGPVLPLSPAQITLAGASPWQPVTLSLCAFNLADLTDNKPATCCRVTAAFAMPGAPCVKK